jgi:hypothetical protein
VATLIAPRQARTRRPKSQWNVIREAIRKEGMVAIGKVFTSSERIIALNRKLTQELREEPCGSRFVGFRLNRGQSGRLG